MTLSRDYHPFGRLRTGPFGQDRNATGVLDNPEHFKWVAREEDEETDMYYFGARYYGPELGRFTAVGGVRRRLERSGSPAECGVDPLWEKYPGWSPYVYALDNPLSERT